MSLTEGTHPRLAKALEAMNRGDTGWAAEIVAIGLGAKFQQDDGHYCGCAEPITVGTDLMCSRCLLNNKGQELLKLDEHLSPHDYQPNGRLGMCEVCTYWDDDARHHGEVKTGRTSWGTDYTPKASA